MRRLCLVLLMGCRSAPNTDAAPSEAPPAPRSLPAVASAAPERPWYEGSWRAAFRAELLPVDVPAGAVKDWAQDDGKAGSGDGTLALQVRADGTARGQTSGALGELSVNGRVEGDRAVLTLGSLTSEGFHGLVLATKSAEGMSGTLTASTGDSLRVRRAQVSFTRASE